MLRTVHGKVAQQVTTSYFSAQVPFLFSKTFYEETLLDALACQLALRRAHDFEQKMSLGPGPDDLRNLLKLFLDHLHVLLTYLIIGLLVTFSELEVILAVFERADDLAKIAQVLNLTGTQFGSSLIIVHGPTGSCRGSVPRGPMDPLAGPLLSGPLLEQNGASTWVP